MLVRRYLFDQRAAIGEANVAPHFWRATGDAGEIAEAATREAQQICRCVRAVAQMIHERECQNMRQVTGGGEDLVVFVNRHL